MFGEAWRIVDAFPNYFLDCRRISGSRRWDDRITSDSGDWSGNVYDFWNRAYLMLSEGLPRPFELGPDMVRIDDTPRHKAVREGLTNVLVHADYYGRTGVVVIRRSSTVEFSNPGSLRLPAEVVKGGGISDPRNKTLMTMFNLIGRGDKAGSGFDVFRDAAKYAGTAEPGLQELLDPERTTLTLHMQTDGSKLPIRDNVRRVVSYEHDDVSGDVNNVVSDVGNVAKNDASIANSKSDEPHAAGPDGTESGVLANVLSCIRLNPAVSAAGIADKLSISPRQVQRYLKQLRETGRITRVGKTNGYWIVNS